MLLTCNISFENGTRHYISFAGAATAILLFLTPLAFGFWQKHAPSGKKGNT